MKKIRLFSAKTTKYIEGDEAELYINFYLVLNRNYIFTFLIDAPNLACSNRNPIKLWKHFLIMFEEEYVKYMRRYEKIMYKERDAAETAYRKGYYDALQNKACWQKARCKEMSKEEQIRECQNKQLIDELLKDRGEFLKKRFNISIDIPEVKEKLDESEEEE